MACHGDYPKHCVAAFVPNHGQHAPCQAGHSGLPPSNSHHRCRQPATSSVAGSHAHVRHPCPTPIQDVARLCLGSGLHLSLQSAVGPYCQPQERAAAAPKPAAAATQNRLPPLPKISCSRCPRPAAAAARNWPLPLPKTRRRRCQDRRRPCQQSLPPTPTAAAANTYRGGCQHLLPSMSETLGVHQAAPLPSAHIAHLAAAQKSCRSPSHVLHRLDAVHRSTDASYRCCPPDCLPLAAAAYCCLVTALQLPPARGPPCLPVAATRLQPACLPAAAACVRPA